MPLRVEPLRDRKLHRLVKAADLRRLRRGEVVAEGGEAARDAWLVREGRLGLVAAAASEVRARTVAVFGPRELLVDLGAPGRRRPERVVAAEPATCVRLDGEAVLQVIRSSARTLAALLEATHRELELARALGHGGAGATADARVALVILDLARRWGERSDGGVRVPGRLTHQELGDLAGVHRSTVTTALNEWLYRGVLRTGPGGIEIPKPDLLERIARDR